MKRATKFFLSALVLLLAFIWAEIVRSPQSSEDDVGLFFFDVGQGDAALIQKGNYQILIDGGPDDKVLPELGRVMPLTDRNIEAVVLSHPHADHLTGLNYVLDHYRVDTIYSSGVVHTSDGYRDFLEKVRNSGIEMQVPDIGEVVAPFNGGKLEFLWPGDQFKEKTVENLNNASLVERFCYFDYCALITGDIETDEQERMSGYYQDGAVNNFQAKILKLPHHGSGNGSRDSLYAMVGPSYSIVSAGADNKYGHPHQSSLDLAEKHQAEILRTDRDGTIKFVLGREGITLQK